MVRDDALPLPAPTPPPAALQGPGDALAHASAARRRPFALSTPRVHVVGCEMAGVASAMADGWPLLSDLRADAGACAAVVVTPSEVRRELAGAAGGVLETVLAAERAAGLVAQWRPSSPGTGATLTLGWTIEVRGSVGAWADDDPEAWHAEGPVLAVQRRLVPGALPALAFQVTPAPGWDVSPVEGALRVRATVHIPAGGHATLLAAGGPGSREVADALAMLGSTRALEVAAAREHAALRRERLALDTGVREVDDALPWASARVHGAFGPRGFRPGSGAAAPRERGFPFDLAGETAWTGLGALAAGDLRAAARAVAGPLGHPLGALLLGRLAAWSGEPERLLERRVDALQAAAGLDPERLGAAERVAWRAALDAWLEAAECLGDPSWAGALRARRDTLGAPGPPSTPGGRRLPVVGDGSGADEDATLVAAVVGRPEAGAYRPPATEPRSALERGVRAWAAYATGAPDDGFRLLRAHLAAAFEHVPGAWRAAPEAPCWDHAAAAAMAPAATLFGMLGARAEAWYGRLRLAPRMPEHWTRMAVGGVAVGDARVGLAYSRRHHAHTFGVRQVGGRVPLMLVFEPEIPLDGPARVWVDGAPAEVGAERVGSRVRVRLQLPLDHDREVRVEPDHGTDPGTS